MKTYIIALTTLITFTFASSKAQDFDYFQQWLFVDSLEYEGLPQSAMDAADKIYKQAKKDMETAQFIKAVIYKLKFNSLINEDSFLQNIKSTELETKNALFPVQPILHSMLAEMYWWYLQNNRYKFYNRTETSDVVDTAIESWSPSQLVKKINYHFQASIADEEKLKSFSVEGVKEIIVQNNLDTISLYDFLAWRAFDFYSNNEASLNRPQEEFNLNSDAFLQPANFFIDQKIQTTDSLSFHYNAIAIIQKMLRYHLNDLNKSKLLNIDLKRLQFVYDNVFMDMKDSLYIKALEFYEKQQSGVNNFLLGYKIAEKLNNIGEKYNPAISEKYKWKKKEAIEKCNDIIKSGNDTNKILAIEASKNLIGSIMQPNLIISTENENLPHKKFRALVQYKNMNNLFIKIIKTNYDEVKKLDQKIESINKKEYVSSDSFTINYFLNKKSISDTSFSLPNDSDYQNHKTEVALPSLDPGYYFILACSDSTFDFRKLVVCYSYINITEISYLQRQLHDGSNEFYVLNRKTGLPINGVKVLCKGSQNYGYENEDKETTETYITDENGHFVVPSSDFKNRGFNVTFYYNNEVWKPSNSKWYYAYPFQSYTYHNSNEKYSHTFFFTDRSIYRPGQTIYFKGIMLETTDRKHSNILTQEHTNVELLDVNWQKVADIDLVTNEYGTFNGSFVAPSKGLTGPMTLRNKNGHTQITVEEYKRPKFEVIFDSLKNAYKIGQQVTSSGIAKSYSGTDIDGAKVTYRVTRNLYVPWHYNYWWCPRIEVPEKQIANGTVLTNENGKFEIKFVAENDENIDPSTKPIFIYTINADITDINGETHSNTTEIRVSNTTLILNADIPEQISKEGKKDFNLSTLNINGDFVATKGTIKVEHLINSNRILRNRNWETPDKYIISKEEFAKDFPFDAYKNENDPRTWISDNILLNRQFNTSADQNIHFENIEKWDQGMYRVTLSSIDEYGGVNENKLYFTLYSEKSETLPYPTANWLSRDNKSLQPGAKAVFNIGSSFENVKVLYEIEADNNIINKSWIELHAAQKAIEIPIVEEYRGNIGVHFTFCAQNRLYKHDETIFVPFTNKELDIQFETFRNKLKPGEKEQWKLKLKGKDGEKIASEMVASLYDASLDAFKKHRFEFDIYGLYYPTLGWSSPNNYTINNFSHVLYFPQYYIFGIPETQHNYLYWFGYQYNMGNYKYIIEQYKRDKDNKQNKFNILSTSSAQGTIVNGIIKGENGETLPGCNITIAGTSYGTISDINGKFSISLKQKDIKLYITYVGYKSQVIPLKNKGKVDIEIFMQEDVHNLQEVMVVGYGTQNKSLFTKTIARKSKAEAPGIADSFMAEASYSVNEDKVETAFKAPALADINSNTEKKIINIQTRSNLQETAFFYPNLQTNDEGEILVDFTIPEAITRWKMLGFAHTKDLKFGFTENQLVTSKDLMATPNIPRFFRENDTIEFTTKVTSLLNKNIEGLAKLMLFDALTMKPIDVELKNLNPEIKFNINLPSKSTNLSWRLIIPEGIQAFTYKVVAQSGNFSDGEEAALPVLTNRMLVTETLPLPLKGKQTKTFELHKLVNNSSSTSKNFRLTLEYTSNPAWYAIQALPYLMEYPYECAEQTFSRFYANSIASYIANSNPKIKKVIDSWQQFMPDALLSNLVKNQELKELLVEETPWVLNAKNESERKRHIALLFDLNKMSNELNAALNKLEKIQSSNGGFPWFKGMPEDRYITQHIVCGMGKLSHLGIKTINDDYKVVAMVRKALQYLDNCFTEEYNNLVRLAKVGKVNLKDNNLTYEAIHYLYTRSYFVNEEISNETSIAIKYYLNQEKQYWLTQNNYMQGLMALTLQRNGEDEAAMKIIKSLREHAIVSEEMGMYWKAENSWFWYQAPIERQAILIEAFDEITHDTLVVNEMQAWLLKQKQTQDWGTTKATVEASYALLLRGANILINEKPLSIKLGDESIDPGKLERTQIEAGTGYFKTSWSGNDIRPEMGKVTLSKTTDGVSWGALYWQYFEQINKITPATASLKIVKKLYLLKITDKGQIIIPITDSSHLMLGDLVKVRIELHVDRTMEYLHMKDMRAACFEPVNVLSQYKWQDGLGYYESTRDAATNFFIHWLPKGNYVFEYPLRVTHKGNFSNGITTIQCMYAPEFTSHSEGIRVKVE